MLIRTFCDFHKITDSPVFVDKRRCNVAASCLHVLTHIQISLYCLHKISSVPTCIGWWLVSHSRLSACTGDVVHNIYITAYTHAPLGLCVCIMRSTWAYGIRIMYCELCILQKPQLIYIVACHHNIRELSNFFHYNNCDQ